MPPFYSDRNAGKGDSFRNGVPFLAACGLADRPLTPAKPQAATRYFAVSPQCGGSKATSARLCGVKFSVNSRH